MTINAVTPVVEYVGDGWTETFPFSFKIFDNSDISVYINAVINTQYSVTGINSDTGGSVIFYVPPVNNDIVRIVRTTAFSRNIDYITDGGIQSSTLNMDFDKNVAMIQELNSGLILEAPDGRIDADNRIIKNVMDPVEPQDTVTKNYADKLAVGTVIPAAASFSFTPYKNITSNNLQIAIQENYDLKADLSGSALQTFNIADGTLNSEAINLSQLNTAQALKADLSGSTTQTFNIADGTLNSEAINLSQLNTAQALKADLAGSSTQTFNIADGTLNSEAINLSQLNTAQALKADLAGSSTQTFNIADGTLNSEAINLSQLNTAQALKADLSGSTLQTFNIANAVNNNEAVSLGQLKAKGIINSTNAYSTSQLLPSFTNILYFYVGGPGSTWTLPPANSVAANQNVILSNRSGGDLSIIPSGSDGLDNISTLGSFQTVSLFSDGNASWHLFWDKNYRSAFSNIVDVTTSRVIGTTYTNTTGFPMNIMIGIQFTASSSTYGILQLTANNIIVGYLQHLSIPINDVLIVYGTIPANATYTATVALGTPTANGTYLWTEQS